MDPILRITDLIEQHDTANDGDFPSNWKDWITRPDDAGPECESAVHAILDAAISDRSLLALTSLDHSDSDPWGATQAAHLDTVAKWQAYITIWHPKDTPTISLEKCLSESLKATIEAALEGNATGPADRRNARVADAVRAYYLPRGNSRSESFTSTLTRALTDTLRRLHDDAILKAPTPVLEAWLNSVDSHEQLIGQIIPEAIGNKWFMGKAAEFAKDSEPDWGTVTNRFVDIFRGQMRAILFKASTPILTRIAEAGKKDIFDEISHSADLGAREGIPFRVDTVFSAQAQPTDIDLHAVLDGALAAIKDDKNGNFNLVTRGKLSLIFDGNELAKIDDAIIPSPVAFAYGIEAGGADIKHAILNYRGHPIIPFNDDSSDLRSHLVRIEYSFDNQKSDIDFSALAYGRTYHVLAGYQALGGILPVDFCDAGNPIALKGEIKNSLDSEFELSIPFRRTLIPGPPRVESNDGAKSFASSWLALESNVRPIWKEHFSNWTFSEQEKLGGTLRTAKTKFLALKDAAVSDTLRFKVRPPALALGEKTNAVRNAAVHEYWIRRDADLGGAKWNGHPGTNDVDDPAVIGKVKNNDGKGGLRFRLWRVSATGVDQVGSTIDIPSRDQNVAVSVSIVVTDAGVLRLAKDNAKTNIVVTAVPQDRFVVQMSTICDSNFFQNGTDVRFSDKVGGVTDKGSGVREFGSSVIAVEVLPNGQHLPDVKLLWDAIGQPKDQKNSNNLVMVLKSPMNSPGFDYIGDVKVVHQVWRWDGGPILADDLRKLMWNSMEDAGSQAARVHFENDYFVGRGLAGAEQVSFRAAGDPSKENLLEVFSVERPATHGAQYHRFRLEATSRYAPLHLNRFDPILRGAAKDQTRVWKSFASAPVLKEALPTPRLGAVVPLFSGIADPLATSGGYALFLDHGWFDTVNGAGLQAQIEVQLIVERVNRKLETRSDPSAGTTAALAIGLDGTKRPGGSTLPVEGGNIKATVMSRAADSGAWTPTPAEAGWNPDPDQENVPTISCSAVLGQTLEPNSPEPQIPFSVAFFDPRIGEQLIKSDVMMKVRCRANVLNIDDESLTGFSSPWSGEHWVHILAANAPDNLMACRKIDAKFEIAAADGGEVHLNRLANRLDDKPNPGFLCDGVGAFALRKVIDSAGREVLRTVSL